MMNDEINKTLIEPYMTLLLWLKIDPAIYWYRMFFPEILAQYLELTRRSKHHRQIFWAQAMKRFHGHDPLVQFSRVDSNMVRGER